MPTELRLSLDLFNPLQGKEIFFLLHSMETGCEAKPASYPVGYFPGGKQHGREADQSPPSSAEVQNGRATLPLPHTCS
jgi:hypothetical protein